MTTSQKAMAVAQNATFQARIRYHLTLAAVSVMAEAANTVGHALRVAYAVKVLNGTADYLSASVAVLTNTTISASIADNEDFGISDADLPFVTNTLFNALAGVAS